MMQCGLKMQNPLWQELYKEVQKKYANVTSFKTV
jgi:hypothetical protein